MGGWAWGSRRGWDLSLLLAVGASFLQGRWRVGWARAQLPVAVQTASGDKGGACGQSPPGDAGALGGRSE